MWGEGLGVVGSDGDKVPALWLVVLRETEGGLEPYGEQEDCLFKVSTGLVDLHFKS